MRIPRCLWMIPLILTAVAAAADVEPSATRIVINGQSRIYRTYGWPTDAEMFAPIAKELQRFGLVSEWQPGRARLTLGWDGTVYRWRVARGLADLREDRRRSRNVSQAEALEMGRELFLPLRTTVALMGGSLFWDEERRALHVSIGAGAAGARPAEMPGPADDRRPEDVPAEPGSGIAVVTRLEWSEARGGLALEVEATAPIRVQTLRLENPSRLVLDFSPATFGLMDPLPPRGIVTNVRTNGQFQPGVARLVLDLNGGSLATSGLPVSPQRRLTIRLAASAAPPKPVAVVPRATAPAIRRPTPLTHRGLAGSRDVERIKELLAQGEAVLRGKVICIDAGHGGHSEGARGVTANTWEKDLCLQMALEAARALREAGATVILTRGDDTFLSLDERIEIANGKGVDLFISIHCNAMPRPNTMSGTETYYYSGHSLDLARAIHPEMVRAMGGRDGGVRRRAFAVVRRTQMPSVLLEVGYINHRDDEVKLSDANYHRAVGEAIRDGVIRYFAG